MEAGGWGRGGGGGEEEVKVILGYVGELTNPTGEQQTTTGISLCEENCEMSKTKILVGTK